MCALLYVRMAAVKPHIRPNGSRVYRARWMPAQASKLPISRPETAKILWMGTPLLKLCILACSRWKQIRNNLTVLTHRNYCRNGIVMAGTEFYLR